MGRSVFSRAFQTFQGQRPTGPRALISAVIAVAAADLAKGDRAAALYFQSDRYAHHLELVGLPADYLPVGVTRAGIAALVDSQLMNMGITGKSCARFTASFEGDGLLYADRHPKGIGRQDEGRRKERMTDYIGEYSPTTQAEYEEWKPAPGSKLWAALEARGIAAAEYDGIAAALETLKERRQETEAKLSALGRAVGVEQVAELTATGPALDALIGVHQKDLHTAENNLRNTTKEVWTLTRNLETALNNVKHFEKLKEDVPGRFTKRDEKKLEEYRETLNELAGALLKV